MDAPLWNTSLNRRAVLRLSLVGGAAALLAACGQAAAPTTVPAKPAEPTKPAEKLAEKPAEPTKPAAGATPQAAAPAAGTKAVELEVWAHWDQGIQWLINSMKNYNFPNPNLTIKKVVYPFDEAHNKMLAALNSGVGVPDIMRVEQGRMSAFLKGNIGFFDLTDRIGARRNDLVLGSAVDYWSWKGKIYGIGNELNVCSLTYRKDLFDEVGVKETGFESWSDFRKAGQDLKAKQNIAAISWHDISHGDFQILTFAAGGKMFDENGDVAFATDIGVDILAMMHEMLHKEKSAIVAPVTGDNTWSPPIYWAAFKDNKIASTIGAPWHNGNLGRETAIGPSQSGKWRLQRLPKGFGANLMTATHGGTSLSIPLKAKNPDEAWQVIEFTHLTKAVLQDFDERGVMVTYKPALAEEKVRKAWEYYGGQKIGEIYAELAQDMPRITQSPWAPEIYKALTDMAITPILQNPNATKNDIKAGFDKVKAEAERIKKL
ncbi:MAG TPA: extracellular solute-binding protein [Chloroflexota bacterium]|nr:extracellular solute-binding protein [Chloroflexota bacterium]